MKIGDSKQAIGLGVVAFVAVGFLAKTAFGALGGGSNKPIEVKELRGGTLPPKESKQPTSDATSPQLKSENLAAKPDANTSLMVRDAFAKFNSSSKEDSKGFSNSARQMPGMVQETMTPNNQVNQGQSLPPAPIEGGLSGSPEPRETEKVAMKNDQAKVEPEKKDPIIFRFDGYVNAGSPMAVVTYKESSFTLNIGDTLPNGWKVEKISGEKITISKGKAIKTILVGREIEF